MVLVGCGSKLGIHHSQLHWMWHFTCLSVAVFDFLLLPKVGVNPFLCFSYILCVYVYMLAQVYSVIIILYINILCYITPSKDTPGIDPCME